MTSLPAAILHETCRRYALDPAEVEPIGSFDNDLYRAERAGAGVVLRISGEGGRSADRIRAEVAWIEHLAAGGVPCARALASSEGRAVEVVDLSGLGRVVAVLFERAPGRPSHDEDITPDFVRAWGATLGRIHALSRGYRPPDPRWIRPDWRQDARAVERLFPPDESAALRRFRAVVRRLEALPRPPEAFGPIHGDAHRGNFFVHEGAPFLFDFYDCLRSWFVADLAIALFYAVMDAPAAEERDAWATWFLRHLLAGYRSEHELESRWLGLVPDLLALRELDTFALILHHLGADLGEDTWDARFMAGRRKRIESGAPYLDLRWNEFG